MKKKNARPSQAESGANKQRYFADLSTEAQRARLLDCLRLGPVSTIDARRNLEVLMPATRIFELRRLGYDIETIRVEQPSENGISHNIALYVLKGKSHEC